uniref:Uncharacterized protein n=1 Tax=Oryza brachyantha TaxID=4533 RepID=J3KV88_ORYBR
MRDWATLMCFDLADQRGPRGGGGGGGRPVKGGGDEYGGGRSAAAATAMTVSGASELMSGHYQAQEMSTMACCKKFTNYKRLCIYINPGNISYPPFYPEISI